MGQAKPSLPFLETSNCLWGLYSMKGWRANTAKPTICSVVCRSKAGCRLFLQKIRNNWAGAGKMPLLINVIHSIYVSQELSSFYQLHVSLVSLLPSMKPCVLFIANSEVLLNCHVPFTGAYIHTPQTTTSEAIYAHQGIIHGTSGTMLPSQALCKIMRSFKAIRSNRSLSLNVER